MQNTESYLKCQTEGIPQLMSLDIPGLTQERLLDLLENLEDEVDEDDVCLEETIFKLNMKTWVCIKLAHYTKAEEINTRVITMTQWENVISIGNCMFLRWRSGRQEEALNCNSKLQAIKQSPSSADSLATANAELAYCYSRVGGPVNMFIAIRLFEDVIGRNADNLYWKLRLGLAYRRCTHLNIYTGMPEGRTIQECVENAAKHLTDVYRHDSTGKLRGPALSELAVLSKNGEDIMENNDIGSIIGMFTPTDMCNRALKLGENNTWVLTNCGKLLRTLKQLDRAAAVLERCLLLRKHTTTHHQLGLCFAKMAKAASRTQNPRTQQRPARGRQAYPVRERDYRYPPANRPLITFNEYFNRAEEQYLEAIQLSHGGTLPAVYNLGLLYKLAGRYQEAVNRFNQVTSYGGEGNMLTLINAYEQAGLCYLLTNNPEADGKLTKAISLAVIVASTCPQLQNCATDIWRSFRTMKDRLQAESPSPSRDPKLLLLYELVKKHKGVVNVLEKGLALSDSQLEDPKVITAGLRGYLDLHETEKAFAFLNMVSIGPNITNSRIWETPDMINLRREVLLSTAEGRLKLQSTDAKFVFQELFKLHYGQCTGGVSEDLVCISNSRDVLLFYDEEHDTEELGQISQTAQALQNVLSQVFGLDTSMNLQGSPTYVGPKMADQLEEMRKYQVVVVVLGEEIRSPEFKAMMAMIPSMAKTVSPSRKVLVIDACQQATQVPGILGHYHCLRLQQTVGAWSQSVALALGGDDYSRVRDNIRNFVGDNQLDVLVLPFLWNKLDRSREGSCCMGNTWSLNSAQAFCYAVVYLHFTNYCLSRRQGASQNRFSSHMSKT